MGTGKGSALGTEDTTGEGATGEGVAGEEVVGEGAAGCATAGFSVEALESFLLFPWIRSITCPQPERLRVIRALAITNETTEFVCSTKDRAMTSQPQQVDGMPHTTHSKSRGTASFR